jgi:hypothetical protein
VGVSGGFTELVEAIENKVEGDLKCAHVAMGRLQGPRHMLGEVGILLVRELSKEGSPRSGRSSATNE